MTATRLPASWMNALDPAAGARRSRWTAAPAGAPRCPDISRRSRPTSGQTVSVPSSFRRGELPRRLRAPFARNVIPGAHAANRARGRARPGSHSDVALCSDTAGSSHWLPRRCPLRTNTARIEAFRQGLRELGYVEGQNLAIEWRFAEGDVDRLPGLAAELVRLKVDVIVTGGAGDTRPATDATTTIPIVMAPDSDPVESGFVTSLARPGGSVTGLSTLHPAISAKRLEILKEMLPRASRVALFGTSTWAGNARGLRQTEQAAKALSVKLQYVDVLHAKDFATAFRAAVDAKTEAVITLVWGPVLGPRRREIAEMAVKSRLPTIYRERESVEAGGLMAYGPN